MYLQDTDVAAEEPDPHGPSRVRVMTEEVARCVQIQALSIATADMTSQTKILVSTLDQRLLSCDPQENRNTMYCKKVVCWTNCCQIRCLI